MKKERQNKTYKRAGKVTAMILTAMLACTVCSMQVFATENGELQLPEDTNGSVQDPAASTAPITDPVPSQGGGTESGSAGSVPSDAPVSTPDDPASTPSNTPSQGGETSSVPDGEISSSEPETPSSSPSSEDDGTSSNEEEPDSRPSSSSRPNYSDNGDDDENEDENYYTNNNGNNTSHRPNTAPPNTIADAPDDDRDILTSQNWNELLTDNSNAESEAGSQIDGMVGGIFSNKDSGGGGISSALIAGIIMLVLGAGGVAFFIYSQFFYKKRRVNHDSFDEEDGYGDYSQGYDDGYDEDYEDYGQEYPSKNDDTAPIDWLERDSGRDIRSHSSRTPPSRGQGYRQDAGQPPESPARKSDEEKMRDIDWDKFFRDNQ